MRRLFFTLCLGCSILAMTICSCDKIENENEKVALLLPSGETLSRWITDANCLKQSLSAYGYDVTLFTADETEKGAAEQVAQLEEVIAKGFKTVVITPIDYTKINESGILESNKDLNVVCYDRMIMDNSAIDSYTTCDPAKIGEMQAQFLLEKLDKEQKTIEYFAGPKTDRNAATYFESAYKLLKNNSLLSVPSGKCSYEDVALDSWSSEAGKAAMADRLSKTGIVPDLILAPNDNVANGIIEAIDEYKPGTKAYPVITGQDMTQEAVANIKAGKQSMTIYKDYENMAETAAMVVNCLMSGNSVITNNYFDNGKIQVPAKYTSFTLVTVYNVDGI